MTEAIRLIQGVTKPEQVNRIVDWNKARNGLALNSDLEVDMLREEAKEYFDAATFVDRVDAVCDLIFVGVGTLAKTANAYHLVAKGLFGPIDFVITDFVGRVEAEGIMLDNLVPMLVECLDAVISANEEKGTEKDENGKIIKPDGFVPPEERIAEIVAQYRAPDGSDDEVMAEALAAGGK